MQKINPFTVTPGVAGKPYIDTGIAEEIIMNFKNKDSATYVYKITGIRGSGKSVEYSKVIQTFKEEKDWLVYPLSAKGKGITTLIAKLSEENFINSKKKETSISTNISAGGNILAINGKGEIGFSRKTENVGIYANEEAMLTQMINAATKKKINILIGIDDISMTPEMVNLLSIIGSMILEGLNVYLVVSGLSKNIEEFSSDKSLSFFRRGTAKEVGPLDKYDIVNRYQKFLGVDASEAKKMYDLTLGYAYAYQVLGSLYFNKSKEETLEELLPDFENDLFKNSYELIRPELTDAEINFIRSFYASNTGKAADIKKHMQNPNSYDMYRKRLINKHIFSDDRRGYLNPRLPRFDRFTEIWCAD